MAVYLTLDVSEAQDHGPASLTLGPLDYVHLTYEVCEAYDPDGEPVAVLWFGMDDGVWLPAQDGTRLRPTFTDLPWFTDLTIHSRSPEEG